MKVKWFNWPRLLHLQTICGRRAGQILSSNLCLPISGFSQNIVSLLFHTVGYSTQQDSDQVERGTEINSSDMGAGWVNWVKRNPYCQLGKQLLYLLPLLYYLYITYYLLYILSWHQTRQIASPPTVQVRLQCGQFSRAHRECSQPTSLSRLPGCSASLLFLVYLILRGPSSSSRFHTRVFCISHSYFVPSMVSNLHNTVLKNTIKTIQNVYKLWNTIAECIWFYFLLVARMLAIFLGVGRGKEQTPLIYSACFHFSSDLLQNNEYYIGSSHSGI